MRYVFSVGFPFRCVGVPVAYSDRRSILLDSSYVARRTLWVVLAIDRGTSDRWSERVITRYFLLDRAPRIKTKEDGPKSESSPSRAADHCDRLGISERSGVRPR